MQIYTDGGARGNPGPAGAGYVFVQGAGVVHEGKKYLGDRQTNNWAEYEAVYLALSEALAQGKNSEPIEIFMDSQLVVEQLKGNWKIKEPNLKDQAIKVRTLLSKFPSYTFTYVPREQNSEADRLVNEVLDENS